MALTTVFCCGSKHCISVYNFLLVLSNAHDNFSMHEHFIKVKGSQKWKHVPASGSNTYQYLPNQVGIEFKSYIRMYMDTSRTWRSFFWDGGSSSNNFIAFGNWKIQIYHRDFYFRAPGSLVVLSFPQPLSFSSVFPKSLSETITDAVTAGCPTVDRYLLTSGAT